MINIDSLTTQIQELKIIDKYINEKVNFWFDKLDRSPLSTKDKVKTRDEIFVFVKFMYFYSKAIHIIDGITERPDFVIECDGKKVGVELTEIEFAPKEKAKIGSLDGVLKIIDSELKLELSEDYNGIYAICFKDVNVRKSDKEFIKKEIIDYLTNNNRNNKFISRIERSPSSYSSIHLYYNSEGYMVHQITREDFANAIFKKEKKIEEYRINSKTANQWLIIIAKGVNESDNYSNEDEMLHEISVNSKFDKVFFFSSFDGKIFEFK